MFVAIASSTKSKASGKDYRYGKRRGLSGHLSEPSPSTAAVTLVLFAFGARWERVVGSGIEGRLCGRKGSTNIGREELH